MYFAKLFVLFGMMALLGYTMVYVSNSGIKYKQHLAKKGIETQAKVIGILKDVDYDSYTYFLEYTAQNKKRHEEYRIKQLWNVHQNADFKKTHPLRSKMTIKYDRRKPEKFIVVGDENNAKVFTECKIVGYSIMAASIILLLLNILQ